MAAAAHCSINLSLSPANRLNNFYSFINFCRSFSLFLAGIFLLPLQIIIIIAIIIIKRFIALFMAEQMNTEIYKKKRRNVRERKICVVQQRKKLN